jgi:hypothetical protein
VDAKDKPLSTKAKTCKHEFPIVVIRVNASSAPGSISCSSDALAFKVLKLII